MTKDQKPIKPYPEFPLYPHATKRWAKTIRGKTRYFGKWEDGWKPALEKYLRERDDLFAGREPRDIADTETSVSDCCNQFLSDKQILVDSGEITQRTWDDYLATCKRIVDFFSRTRPVESLTPSDFARFRSELSKTRNPNSLGNEVGRVRVVFNHIGPRGICWLDRDVQFGSMFKKPTMKAMRIHRSKLPDQVIPAKVIRDAVASCNEVGRAMILLGINCGLGNTDCASLCEYHVDWKEGWLIFPRPKTGVDRRAKLWTATMEALLACRSDLEPMFRTQHGNSWEGTGRANPISAEFRKTLKSIDEHRPGRGFYSLRRTFQTVAEESGDFPAISLVMGHDDGSMASRYRQRISDARLERVAETVADWLVG